MKKNTIKIEFDLLNNSKDYMEQAIENALKGYPKYWKYSVINLASALELLFKAFLEKEHWSLVFHDIDNASKEMISSY